MISITKTSLLRMVALSGLWICCTGNAQEIKPAVSLHRPNELSVRYSNLTGYGVAYQRNLISEYYVRATAWLKYYDQVRGVRGMAEYQYNADNNYSVGLDLQRNIIHENKYRVYGMVGGGYTVRLLTNQYNYKDQSRISAGFGGGIEYFLLPSLSADLGLSYKFDYDKDQVFPGTITRETTLGVSAGVNLSF